MMQKTNFLFPDLGSKSFAHQLSATGAVKQTHMTQVLHALIRAKFVPATRPVLAVVAVSGRELMQIYFSVSSANLIMLVRSFDSLTLLVAHCCFTFKSNGVLLRRFDHTWVTASELKITNK
jgi:hypothetical protein